MLVVHDCRVDVFIVTRQALVRVQSTGRACEWYLPGFTLEGYGGSPRFISIGHRPKEGTCNLVDRRHLDSRETEASL
jgi:hypothetical protein